MSADDAVARRRRGRRAVGVGAGVIVAILGVLWIVRTPVANTLIARELAARHVRMSYRIAAVGPRTQRIENVVLGDPRHPELTARWVEVDLAVTGLSAGIAAVRADGVRLHGQYRDGKLHLGEIEKLLGEGGSADTVLPDMDLVLRDVRASIATRYGALGMVFDGRGNPRESFDGRVVMAMPRIAAAGCGGRRLIGDLRIALRDGAPRIDGPMTARAIACPGMKIALAAPHLNLSIIGDEHLRGWKGRVKAGAAAARGAGMTLGKAKGETSFAFDGRRIDGKASLIGDVLSGRGMIAGRSSVTARFVADRARQTLQVTGRLALADMSPRAGRLAGLGASLAGTPLAPLAVKFDQAVVAASRDNSLAVRFAVNGTPNGGEGTLSDVRFASASGARLALPGNGRASLRWPGGAPTLSGTLGFGGGGLPSGTARLASGPGGAMTGRLTLQPYAHGGAALALHPVDFRVAAGGATSFATSIIVDGPLADGAVTGLAVPLSGRFGGRDGIVVNPRCVPAAWRSLRISTLALAPMRTTLCPSDGGAMLRMANGRVNGGASARALALYGRLGNAPISMRANRLDVALSTAVVRAGGLDVRIGRDDAPIRLAADTLDARFAHGLAGRFGGGRARIGTVPFDITRMAGNWRFAGGRLDVDGALRLSDTAPDARFNPLFVRDARLRLADGRIAARGHVRHPSRGGDLAAVTIAHDLGTGIGRARFDLQDVHFGPGLQPDDLTPLARGVIANVDGTVTGAGDIGWTGDKVVSTGRFSTTGMNLAAAFGPVAGLSTTLRFTDLVALETAPGQVATIASVNPGVAVDDGRVVFRLLRGSRAAIEGGSWPFAGGRLTLLPSTLDFDAKGARHLIFRVNDLDAGAFINTLDLKNLSATGTYDGLLPMVFDADGGRIVGGILVARQQGLPPLIVQNAQSLTVPCDPARQAGTLSYVGDVSNANMGTYGRMAFDALKRLNYRCLTILLDGALDGEFVTRLAINGVNQGSEESRKSPLLRPFLGLPFLFNVRIEAPFRGLMGTYQSFTDPSALIRNSLGPQFRTVLENRLAVQPADSDKGVTTKGDRP